MGKSFDDILKKGKNVVDAETDPKVLWKDCISSLMYELHRLNEMYNDDLLHHILVGLRKCELCGKATFSVDARELDDEKKAIRFHKGDWKLVDGKYYCEKCK